MNAARQPLFEESPHIASNPSDAGRNDSGQIQSSSTMFFVSRSV